MQQPIVIETLGALRAHGYGMNATCERCRHRTDLHLLALIERLGPTRRRDLSGSGCAPLAPLRVCDDADQTAAK